MLREPCVVYRGWETGAASPIMPDGNGRYQCICCILQQGFYQAWGILPDERGVGPL